jgi:hypothetical protein
MRHHPRVFSAVIPHDAALQVRLGFEEKAHTRRAYGRPPSPRRPRCFPSPGLEGSDEQERDRRGIVDGDRRVRGIRKLGLIDASILVGVPSLASNMTILITAERSAAKVIA